MDQETAIHVEHVSKDFVLPHEKVTSVKSLFTNFTRHNKKKTKETQHALKDISFDIKKGEFFGIVGRNGSGKSTLLKILAGIYQPTSGKSATYGKLVPFIELGVGFNPELTGRENVYLNGAMLGFSEKEVEAMYDDIVSFAELERFMDQKLKNYSSGMQVRLAFSMATRAKADILLVDEVLAVGDADFQRKSFEYFKKLKKDKRTVVFISHDMGAIREFCDRAALIDDNELKIVGTAQNVAMEYSLLFMDNQINEADPEAEPADGPTNKRRWGTGGARFTNIKSSIVGDELQVEATVSVSQPIDVLIYGLHVTSQDGSDVVVTNNRLVHKDDVRNLSSGSEIKFLWKMLNVFNDGKYYITLTLVDDGTTAFDWYNDASHFTVKRTERSMTSVMPPLAVEYKVDNNNRDGTGQPKSVNNGKGV
jgi:ABC-2 type transport system ATP-binding protein